MSDGSDETWNALVAVAARLSQLSDFTVEVWAFQRRRPLRVTEGLDAGDKWVYGFEQPVRWRRPFSTSWHAIRTVEAAAEPIETFLRERPDR